MSTDPHLLDDLEWRGLIAHSTDLDALRAALDARAASGSTSASTRPRRACTWATCVQILTARRLQDAGHTPYALVGGATGMIGDPKDSGERTLNSLDTVKELGRAGPRARSSRSCPSRAPTPRRWSTTTTGPRACRRSTSCATSASTSRSTGCWRATSCARRLEAGISYTEFSYVLLQSMDFLNLYRDHGVTLQFGGTDQWGNLTGGVELIRRADGGKAHAFATPLVTKADGTKYGKTEGGALWLDPEMMSPYAFYQFWLNVEDDKVGELLRIFTFLSRDGDRGRSRQQTRREAVPAGRAEGAGRRR